MTITQADDARAVTEAYDRFVREGFHEAERRLHLARNSGALWPRLEKTAGLNQLWNSVATRVSALEDIIRSKGRPYSSLMEAISLVESSVTDFVEGMDSVAVRPGPEMREIRDLAQASERMRTPSTATIANNCPAIAICREDFIEVIFLVLENAKTWAGASGNNETAFYFRPLEASTLVLLEVSQTGEWNPRHRLEGGFTRMRELLEHSGASLSLERTVRPGEPFLSIRFFAWPLEAEASNAE